MLHVDESDHNNPLFSHIIAITKTSPEESTASPNGLILSPKDMQPSIPMTHAMSRLETMMLCGRASILGHPRRSPILR